MELAVKGELVSPGASRAGISKKLSNVLPPKRLKLLKCPSREKFETFKIEKRMIKDLFLFRLGERKVVRDVGNGIFIKACTEWRKELFTFSAV